MQTDKQTWQRKANIASIPPLRDGTTWLLDAKAKADTFAKTFDSKSQLAPETVDCPFFGLPDVEIDEFVAFRTRSTRRLFRKLNESKATGNDRISAAIVKRLSDCLAMPFTRVCRRLFYEVWKMHMIIPIFKCGSAFKAGNYRGVHLTTILSKLAEKIIGAPLVPFLQRNAFGQNH